jgi:putative addiction module component (TIGR02574 family)
VNIESIVSGFRQLSPDEKVRLVQEFWDQIADDVQRSPLTDSQRQLLDEWLADEERNPDDVEPWAKAKDDILRDLCIITKS